MDTDPSPDMDHDKVRSSFKPSQVAAAKALVCATTIATTVQSKPSMAKFRWGLLASAVTYSSCDRVVVVDKAIPSDDSAASNDNPETTNEEEEDRPFIRYPSYSLVKAEKLNGYGGTDEEDRIWYRITSEDVTGINIKIGLFKPFVTRNSLFGFNNTGNVCVWPAEECLAAFCLENRDLVAGRDVVELGCGMTGLAGLILHQVCKPRSVTLTDGNSRSVDNLSAIVRENNFDERVMRVRQLVWDKVGSDLEGKFDLVICADCVFFPEFRQDLRDCIYKVLRPGGRVLLVAPRRGSSLAEFVQICQSGGSGAFDVRTSDDYSSRVSTRRAELMEEEDFNEDQHYPILTELYFASKEERKELGNRVSSNL